jgi:DNA-binding MarR family transcriptional regulator
MTPKPMTDPDAQRRRGRLKAEIRDSLRELTIQLAMLNRQVGAHLELRDVDLDCLNLLDRRGSLSPKELAQQAGLHPATLTGILDRLERDGWIARDRDPADRRGLLVRSLRDRSGEMMRMYAGMNSSLNQICNSYDDAQLAGLVDFLSRTAAAGRAAVDDLAAGRP